MSILRRICSQLGRRLRAVFGTCMSSIVKVDPAKEILENGVSENSNIFEEVIFKNAPNRDTNLPCIAKGQKASANGVFRKPLSDEEKQAVIAELYDNRAYLKKDTEVVMSDTMSYYNDSIFVYVKLPN